MKYVNYRYLYPPRPKNAVSPHQLDDWDNNMMLAQPKLNGSNCLIFTNGIKFIVMNRHNQRLTRFNLNIEDLPLYKGDGWMVINAEYMNKAQTDENDELFNHKLVIFDILVYNGEYLVGKTFEQRIELLDELYGKVDSDKDYLYKISDNIYRVKSYQKDFKNLYYNLIQNNNMIEGLVMKRKNARLEMGNSELNNHRSQVKCRKITKNYRY
jgi:hypothetical protein